jgi:hypothetical protein
MYGHAKCAAIGAGVIKKGNGRQSGLHNLSHSPVTSPISFGFGYEDRSTLMRHANPATTRAVYAQGIDANRLAAQGAMMDAVLHPDPERLQ